MFRNRLAFIFRFNYRKPMKSFCSVKEQNDPTLRNYFKLVNEVAQPVASIVIMLVGSFWLGGIHMSLSKDLELHPKTLKQSNKLHPKTSKQPNKLHPKTLNIEVIKQQALSEKENIEKVAEAVKQQALSEKEKIEKVAEAERRELEANRRELENRIETSKLLFEARTIRELESEINHFKI